MRSNDIRMVTKLEELFKNKAIKKVIVGLSSQLFLLNY